MLGALRQGAYDFLRKPIPPDILLHSVARSIQKLSLTLETEKQEKEIQKLLNRSQVDLKDARTLSSFKGFMISMAAHDFRSIITVLDGYMQFIRERCKGCDATQPAGILDQAARTVGRLRTMASTLLDYEAAESGSILFDIRPFPLSDTAGGLHRLLPPLCGAEKDPVGAEGGFPWRHRPRRPRKGDADPRQPDLQRSQVHPFPGDDPPLGKEEDGVAVICVSDSGAGIPEEKLQKIFDQGDMVATLDSHARLGLGLTICKRLVEAQKGKIRIDSAPGKGTQVHFSLPVA